MKNDAGNKGNEQRGGRELSREEARRKREQFLALAREQALDERNRCTGSDADDDEPTVATMILPGD